jgi:hypothetical protein
MRLLVKFPTRNRWDKFFKLLDLYQQTADNLKNIEFVITCDINDASKPSNIAERISKFKNITVISGVSTGKIHACNRDMEMLRNWDIVLLASDDMIPQIKGWDTKIINDMQKHFPDKDGVLWYNDGYTKNNLNTMCILGYYYYKRFNYIYNPEYISLWCDNEFTEVSKRLKKVVYSNDVLFKHEHPANGSGFNDNLYKLNEKFYNIDKETYLKRKKNNFDLNEILTE